MKIKQRICLFYSGLLLVSSIFNGIQSTFAVEQEVDDQQPIMQTTESYIMSQENLEQSSTSESVETIPNASLYTAPSLVETEQGDTVVSNTWGTSTWNFDMVDGILTINSGNIGEATTSPWRTGAINGLSIKKIVLTGSIVAPRNSSSLFSSSQSISIEERLNNLISIENLAYLDTSKVVDMYSMFYGSNNLVSIDVSQWDTSAVTDMSYMFYGTSNLINIDVSQWNTGAVTTTKYMFYNARNLVSLNTSNWDTHAIQNISYMFSGTKNIQSIDVKNWDTSSINNMSSAFSQASSLQNIDVSQWNTSLVTDMSSMFSNTNSLQNLDVGNWNTSKVQKMSSMFSSTNSLQSIDVSRWDTARVNDMTNMFRYYGGTNLDVSKWDTRSVTSMASMFAYMLRITNLNIREWDTSKVTSMSQMFFSSSNIESLDVSQWDTRRVKNMQSMFASLGKITSLDVSQWDTSSVTNTLQMFAGAKKLTQLDLSNFNFSSISDNTENVRNMLLGTQELSQLSLGASFVDALGKGTINLPAISKTPRYSGGWIGVSDTNKDILYKTSNELMSVFTADTAGTYVWQENRESLVVKDTTILKGSTWTAADNFVSATNAYGEEIDSSELTVDEAVNTEIPGEYEVTYTNDFETVVAKVTVTTPVSVLTVQFLDETSQVMPLHTVIIDGEVGDTIDLTKEDELIHQLAVLKAAGYEIIERPINENKVLLSTPAVTVQYKLTGILSVNTAPPTFDFGSLMYTAHAQRINDPTYIGKLSILDSRADRTSGWQVTAEMATPLTNTQKPDNILPTALRYVMDNDEKILTEEAQIIYINTEQERGVVTISDSWGETAKTEGLKLQIDSTDRLATGNYTGTIIWKVMAGQP